MQEENILILRTVNEYTIDIAGITMRATTSNDDFSLIIEPIHELFLSTAKNPDIDIVFHYGEIPEVTDLGDLVFETNGIWSMYDRNGEYVIPFTTPVTGPKPYRIGFFDKAFSKGNFHIEKYSDFLQSLGESNKPAIYPFEGPLDELLIINRLAQGLGISIHSCGVDYNSLGLVFFGSSGAGKSTMAGLWKERQSNVLSDERVIATIKNGDIRVHGTPWLSSAKASAATSAMLSGVFLLKHSTDNRLRKLSKTEALSQIFSRCVYPLYSRDGVANTMAIIDEVINKVPVYELGFKPDQSAIDFVLAEIGG